jgi:hypothetical protein
MSMKRYRPGTDKLMQHVGHLANIQAGLIVAPIHVSVWPTLSCQCRCEYCCCRNEEQGQPDLTWQDFVAAVDALVARGTKAIEFAGGGEPLLWPQFAKGVAYCRNKGLKVSLITNGLALGDIPKGTLAELAWLRVSVQSIRHAGAVNFKHAQEATRVSASFIATGTKELEGLRDFMRSAGIVTRVAIKQPCDNDMKYRMIKSVTEALGEPLFFADKPTGTPPGCYMAWVRAAIDWTGHFLPCPSVMLDDDGGTVKKAFRLCHASKLGAWLDANPPRDLGFRCAFCNCGKENNELVHKMFERMDDADFV